MAKTNIVIEDVQDIMIYGDDEVLNAELKARYDIFEKIINNVDKGNHSVVDVVGYYISTIYWRLKQLKLDEVAESWKKILFEKHYTFMTANKLPISTYPCF